MGYPWDAPPFPKRGNKSPKALYQSIGQALTTWEYLEGTLANLYAAFCEKEYFDDAANLEYGHEANFRSRFHNLKKAADRYFVRYPNQETEGEFHELARHIEGYADRRNDVAHGVVDYLHFIRDRGGRYSLLTVPQEWCLIPPRFKGTKYIDPQTPAHVLTSREINKFTNAFWPLIRRASALMKKVELPKHALRRKRALRRGPPGSWGFLGT